MKKIRELRKRKELTMKQLGELVGVAESTISLYETGKRQPDTETLSRLADIFNTTVDTLLGREEKTTATKIPVLGKVVAGIPVEAVEDILDYEEISPDMASTGEFFALKITGKSMEPKFSEGDVVIVRQQPDVDNGDIAIVLINGNAATVKKVKKSPEGITLIPLNPAFDVLFLSNAEIESMPVTIIGKVIELRAKF